MNKKTRILINASTNAVSGGLIVAVDYIQCLISNNNYEILLISPNSRLYRQFEQKIKICFVPKFLLKRYLRWYLDYFWIPRTINSFNPNVVLTLTNLPAVTHINQIFLHQNPYVTHTEFSSIPFSVYDRLIQKLRKLLFQKRIKYVKRIITQTPLEKSLLEKTINNTIAICVLSPFLPFHLQKETLAQSNTIRLDNEKIKVVFPSRYYEHKNLQIFAALAETIRTEKYPIQFILTLNKKVSKRGYKIKKEIKKYPDVILDIGQIQPEKVPRIVNQCDFVIVPSLIETYGLNCIEAWYLKKPLLISNLDFARMNCGDAAEYFNPYDPRDIINKIIHLYKDDIKRQTLIQKGEEKIINLPDQIQLFEIIESMS